jgi:hypothetical protein
MVANSLRLRERLHSSADVPLAAGGSPPPLSSPPAARRKLRLVQLPVPPPAALAATGNVPLAAGCLGVAAQVHGFSDRVEVQVLAPGVTDSLGDTLLAERLAADEPDFLGLSLYLWNVERSLHLAREVKRRSPHTRVLVGGPEVSADNRWLLEQPGFDVAVAGEGEEALADLLAHELSGRALTGIPGVSVRTAAGLSPQGPALAAKFPLSGYPSPYLTGLVAVEPERSAYVEGARGCLSKCTFCFYPKAASGLRVLDPSQVEALVSGLRVRGAKELSFLDPTFNHRPDFEGVLEALVRANPDRTMSLFAEVRPEGLSAAHAALLARAGFSRLEIGLQSVNARTLKRVQRGGNPAMVAAAAKLLRAQGIDLLVDLIVGLPGDTADDVARGVDYLEKHALGEFAQVFALFVLPGTAMRERALEDGLVFEPEPPYRIIRTATLDEQAIESSLRAAEERLGRRLDERPRPHLVAPDAEARDVFHLDLGCCTAQAREAAARPGAQHCALWFEGDDLFGRRAELASVLAARQAVDPYATLDVVLAPSQPFPLDLLEVVSARLDAATPSYATRELQRRSAGQHRVSVVLGASVAVAPDWVQAVMAEVQVFRDQSLAVAAADAARLGDELPGARIVGAADDAADLKKLEAEADPECVVFADRRLEARWQQQRLGYGDAGS